MEVQVYGRERRSPAGSREEVETTGLHARTVDEHAVAPVIAEVLLVAISVTIAGVVYFTASNLTAQSMVPARPFVAFAPVTVRDGVATITVAAVSRTASVSSYRVNLIAGGAVGRATALPAPGGVATISIGSANYRVAWTDVGGSSTLMSGDPITVTAATGPLPTGTVFTFYLLWSDGSMLQSASWTS